MRDGPSGVGVIAALYVAVLAAPASASWNPKGGWEQVSVTFDGKVMPQRLRPLRKIVLRGHGIEVGTEAG